MRMGIEGGVTVEAQTRVRVGTVAFPAFWLLLVGAAEAAALVALWWYFVRTEAGQVLDTIALAGNSIGQDRVDGLANTVLNAVSLTSLAVATLTVAVVALARGRLLLTLVATAFVVGANLTTQVLKHGLYRPDFGVDPERASAGNSFPSGHATVAMSVVVALVLVLPPRVRGVAAVAGAVYATVAGVATMSLGWHRPSDVAGAVLIVGGWAAAAGLLLVLAQGRDAYVRTGDAHRLAATVLMVTGLALLAAAAGAFHATDTVGSTPVEEMGRPTLFTAYAGAAAGIAGVTCAVMALTLATLHRIVPWRTS
jgi:membrane-associated phospholipid phosphatase